jgi:hypothetical protein
MRWLPVALLSMAASMISATASSGLQSGTIRGVVYDSVGERSLAGATVQLVDVQRPAVGRTATTDSAGQFAFTEVASGRYVLGFVHDVLDSLGLDPPRLAVEVREGQVQDVRLGIPGPSALVALLCGADVGRDSTGLFVGRLRDVQGKSVPGGTVVVGWTEVRITRRGLERAQLSQSGKSGDDGLFAICSIPTETTLIVRGWRGADSTGLIELVLPSAGLLRRNLFIGQAATTLVARTNDRVVMREGITPTMLRDTTALIRTSRGSGRVRGTIQLLNGGALRDVHVSIWGSGLETTTDAAGTFTLDSVPEGSQTIVARQIGLAPYRGVVDVTASGVAVHDVTLAPVVTMLDTLRVRARAGPADSWRTAFEARRRRGLGEFLDETQIERMNPQQVADLLRDMPGIDVLSAGTFGRRVLMRGRAAGMFCIPAVFVDGLRFYTGGQRPGSTTDYMEYTGTADLEYVVNPRDVKAIEVYPRDAGVPVEFDDPNDGCGSIVIWTGARRH